MRRPSPKVWSKAASEVLYSFSFGPAQITAAAAFEKP